MFLWCSPGTYGCGLLVSTYFRPCSYHIILYITKFSNFFYYHLIPIIPDTNDDRKWLNFIQCNTQYLDLKIWQATVKPQKSFYIKTDNYASSSKAAAHWYLRKQPEFWFFSVVIPRTLKFTLGWEWVTFLKVRFFRRSRFSTSVSFVVVSTSHILWRG